MPHAWILGAWIHIHIHITPLTLPCWDSFSWPSNPKSASPRSVHQPIQDDTTKTIHDGDRYGLRRRRFALDHQTTYPPLLEHFPWPHNLERIPPRGVCQPTQYDTAKTTRGGCLFGLCRRRFIRKHQSTCSPLRTIRDPVIFMVKTAVRLEY
jgi:hypothetical protein